jgi:DNA-binding SARP family transcriptional activator
MLPRPPDNGQESRGLRYREATLLIDMRILGPLAVRVDGRPIGLGPRLRVLLLSLVVASGQPVPASRLADLVWPGGEPDGWPATLRSHVCHLRRALAGTGQADAADAVLVTERVGAASCYALRIPREMIDAACFEQLVTEGRSMLAAGRHATAAALLREALALWRGTPLADVAGQPFAVSEIRRLEALYRTAQMGRIEASMQLGLHREVIGDVEAMLARWPGDHGLLRLLVTCLCRSERPGEAAWACRAGIELALDQGLDISSLQALQRDVLTASPNHGALRQTTPAGTRPRTERRHMPRLMITHLAAVALLAGLSAASGAPRCSGRRTRAWRATWRSVQLFGVPYLGRAGDPQTASLTGHFRDRSLSSFRWPAPRYGRRGGRAVLTVR